ncbi:MAG: metallophosphoesterase family protein [Acetivibrionales bacterium]|jgi:Icc-related predicted phosphoesterase|nr:metallophosphoesterase [Clostridiaceae bacterium]
MQILLLADSESNYIWDHFDHERFKDIDLVISCGDIKSEYLSFIATMIAVPVFYVHGNHDTNYEENPPGGCDSIEDKLVEYKGLRILGLGGSRKYNNHPETSVPPYQYTEKQMRRRIRKLKLKLLYHKGFDILVTHSPARGISDGDDACHTGFEAFLPLIEKHKPKYMIHGHMHLKFGQAPRKVVHNDTTFIDAYGYYILDIPDSQLNN